MLELAGHQKNLCFAPRQQSLSRMKGHFKQAVGPKGYFAFLSDFSVDLCAFTMPRREEKEKPSGHGNSMAGREQYLLY